MDHTNDAAVPRKAPRLTGDDRRIIAQSRALAELSHDGICARFPEEESRTAYARALGAAQFFLGELAGLTERLSAAEPSPPGDTRRLGEIRALLAAFDWEHDDRQYALEAVERIAGGDQP